MKTGVTNSKSRKRFQIVAAVTGSAAIIALSIAFVAVDFNDLYISSAFHVDDSAIAALEPNRSDPWSEQDGSDDDTTSKESSNDSDDYSDHGEPCLDPNCPIHHDDGHQIPCDDPNCSICNHDIPCGDPDCPICDGHGLPCDNPDCPIHHGDKDFRPPVDISMEIVRFKPNSYEYIDENEAKSVLSQYIEAFDRYFDRYSNGKIYLVGCIAKTASWSLTETELSQQRADTVRQSLIDLGVDENKLISMGIGISDPWRSDEWAKGYFDEETAKLNRRVWIIPDQYNEQVDVVIATDEYIKQLKEQEQL